MSTGYCRDCVSGVINSGTPTGSETTVHGLPTYVARPEGQSKGLIVIIPDSFGWVFPNSRVLADKYAHDGGFTVYLPDFMGGRSCPLKVMTAMDAIISPASLFETIFYKPYHILQALSGFLPWLILCRQSVCKPRIFNFFKALRASPETANTKVGAAGFCWGGKYAVLLSHDMPSTRIHRADTQGEQLMTLVDACYTAHPSFLNIPGDINDVTIPLSIAVGDEDMALKVELVEIAKTILEKKKSGDHEVVIYAGAKHGFAVRGDPKDPKQVDLGEKAGQQALAWFTKWLV